jgi:hypothetical protein
MENAVDVVAEFSACAADVAAACTHALGRHQTAALDYERGIDPEQEEKLSEHLLELLTMCRKLVDLGSRCPEESLTLFGAARLSLYPNRDAPILHWRGYDTFPGRFYPSFAGDDVSNYSGAGLHFPAVNGASVHDFIRWLADMLVENFERWPTPNAQCNAFRVLANHTHLMQFLLDHASRDFVHTEMAAVRALAECECNTKRWLEKFDPIPRGYDLGPLIGTKNELVRAMSKSDHRQIENPRIKGIAVLVRIAKTNWRLWFCDKTEFVRCNDKLNTLRQS